MSVYSDHIQSHSGLIVHYRHGEGSGTVLDDVHTNNLNGTYGSGLSWVSGAIANDSDQAISAPGTVDVATVPANSLFDLADGPLSIEFWAMRGSIGGGDQGIVTKGAGTYQARFVGATDRIGFYKQGTANALASSTVAITDTTTWHHFVFTKNNAAPIIYVDGSNVTNPGTNVALINAPAAVLRLGHTAAATARYNGKLDEFALYSEVLTADDVLYHYNLGMGTPVSRSAPAAEASVTAPSPAYSVFFGAPAAATSVAAVIPEIRLDSTPVVPAAVVTAETVPPTTRLSIEAPAATASAGAPEHSDFIEHGAVPSIVTAAAPAPIARIDVTVEAPAASVEGTTSPVEPVVIVTALPGGTNVAAPSPEIVVGGDILISVPPAEVTAVAVPPTLPGPLPPTGGGGFPSGRGRGRPPELTRKDARILAPPASVRAVAVPPAVRAFQTELDEELILLLFNA